MAAVIALRPPMFTAASLIHVAERKPALVFETEAPHCEGDGREFRLAQQQLLKSRVVAQMAIASAKSVCPEMLADQPSASAWLAESLEVGFPTGTQVMEVKLKGEDGHEMALLVNAVVQAYMDLVLKQEQTFRNRRLDNLARVYSKREDKVREKRRQLQEMVIRSGIDASVDPSSEWQIAMNRLNEVHRELPRYGSILEDLRGEIEVRQADVAREVQPPIPAAELRHLALNDPGIAELSAEFEEINRALAQIRSAATPAAVARIESPYLARREHLKTRMNVCVAELEKRTSDTKRFAALEKIRTLQQQKTLAERRVKQMEESARQWRQKLEGLNPPTVNSESIVEIEMLKSEIKQLDRVLSTIAEDREKELVELAAEDRVKVIQKAEVSSDADRAMRWFLVGVIGFVALLLSVIGVIVWDSRQRLIGSPREISEILRIGLLGTVPKPSRSRSNTRIRWPMRNRDQASFSDATDTIAVRLLREAQIENKRVIAVCSAIGDEGRQALASQIARSLASSDQRTLLVDGNLQHPSLHCEFGSTCEPGVTDIVTGALEMTEVLHETSVMNLWFMPAGSWNQRARAALANGNFGTLLEELVGLFDFVVLDTGVILAGIDTRYLCQHADTVVLSVMRDISRASDIHVARSALESLGVGELSAVVCGATEAQQYDFSIRTRREASAWTL